MSESNDLADGFALAAELRQEYDEAVARVRAKIKKSVAKLQEAKDSET